MKTKRTGGAPPDDRKVLPLSQEEIDAPRKIDDARERMKIHRILLTESLRRLRAGRTLEREHGVIHPEMTAITRDVLRLTDLVFPGQKVAEEETTQAEPSDGARALCELVDRASPAKVARIAAADPALVKRWMTGAELPDEARRVALESRLRIPRDAWERRTA
jgi:hypothetical protein